MFMRGVIRMVAFIVCVDIVLIGIVRLIIGEGLILIFACGLMIWVPVLGLIATFLLIALLLQKSISKFRENTESQKQRRSWRVLKRI